MALRHVAKELKFPFSLICKENEAEQFKSTDKTILDVGCDLQICPYTLCTFVLPQNLFVTIFTRFFFSLRCGQTSSDDSYAHMIKVRASSVSDVKERWTYLWLFLQTLVLCGTVSEAQSVARN